MLIPALGFVVGCGFFGVVGALLLRLFRRQRLGPKGLLFFVSGAMVASAGAAWLYRVVVADAQGQLHSGVAVIAFFGVLLVAGIAGGLGVVFLFSKRRVA
jgi:hypothetical protein